MQRIGLVWLVLQLSNSGVMLGVTAAMQYVPVLVLGMWAGVIADRLGKRLLLLYAQGALIVLSLALWLLTAIGVIEMWMVLALAASLGCVKALSRPAEQTFIIEMVSTRNVVNAVGLNSIVFNGARAVGPAVAGVLISTVGLATTFPVNGLSYLGIVVALLLIRSAELNPAPRARRSPGQLRDGLRYRRRSPQLLGTLLLMTTAGIFAYQWEVSLPLLARDLFPGDVNAVAAMFMALGVGATLGGLGNRAIPPSQPRCARGLGSAFQRPSSSPWPCLRRCRSRWPCSQLGTTAPPSRPRRLGRVTCRVSGGRRSSGAW